MPRLRDAEQALSFAANMSRQPYICMTCRAHAIRQFHSSPTRPFLNRIRESLFGSTESKEAKKQREEKMQQRVEEQAKRDAARPALETKVGRRGREYQVAAIVDPSINPEYIMSTNWDGLRRIGSDKWIREEADAGVTYTGFLPQKRMKFGDGHWQLLLHHITVEALALIAAGRDVNDICLPRSGGAEARHDTRRTSIIPDEDSGGTSLRFVSAQSHQRVLASIPDPKKPETQVSTEQDFQELEENKPESADVEAAEDDATPGGSARELHGITALVKLKQYESGAPWMAMQLNDPLMKFTMTKRITQLTGHRIPDPAISNAHTLRDLYHAVKAKEPPKKLAHSTELKQLDKKVANVVVHAKRQTPIHKEKDVGRWKVITDELIARDLPVTGSRFVDAMPRTSVKKRQKNA